MRTDTHLEALASDARERHDPFRETKADAFEAVATDRAVQAFDALRSLYIAQNKQRDLALVYEQIFEATAWPDMNASHVSRSARRIITAYAEALRWFEAAKLESVA